MPGGEGNTGDDVLNDAYWARLDELYPINDNWQEDGWSAPRFKGTGRRPERGKLEPEEDDIETKVLRDARGYPVVDERGYPIFERPPSDTILPKRSAICGYDVSFLFDGQYVYTCDADNPGDEKSWRPYARTPQDWETGWLNSRWWLQGNQTGLFCFIPQTEQLLPSRLWIKNPDQLEADPDVLALLMAEKNHFGANLYFAHLENANLEDVQLIGAKLKNACLQRAVLKATRLRNAILYRAHLEYANLWDADMAGVDLGYAYLNGAMLASANLKGAKLFWAELKDATLRNAQLKGASLEDADLRGAHLDHANFESADLTRVRLDNAHLQNSHLERTTMRHAQLEGANLINAHIKGAKLSHAHLKHVKMRLAYLQFADLSEANLEETDMSQADLEGAEMYRTNLVGAWMAGANLRGANLWEAQFGEIKRIVDVPHDEVKQDSEITGSQEGDEGGKDATETEQRIETKRTAIHNANFALAHLKDNDLSGYDLRSVMGLSEAAIINCDLEGSRFDLDQFKEPLLNQRIAVLLAAGPCYGKEHTWLKASPRWLYGKVVGRIGEDTRAGDRQALAAVIKHSRAHPRYGLARWRTWHRMRFHRDNPEVSMTAELWLKGARDTYLRIKKCYMDQGAYDAAAEMAYREKEMERHLKDLAAIKSFWHWREAARHGIAAVNYKLKQRWQRFTRPIRVFGSWVKAHNEHLVTRHLDPEQQKSAPSIEEIRQAIHLMDTAQLAPPSPVAPGVRPWPALVTWLRDMSQLFSYHFYRAIIGYGEYPFRVAWTAAYTVLGFAALFFVIGTPVVIDTQGTEVVYGLMPWIDSGLSGAQLWQGVRQAVVLSLESFSSLGFWWMSQERFTVQNFWAALECLWGVYLVALFVWGVGRRLSAR